jgi:hypothetical protein
MSVTYSLHRVKQPLAERPLTTATITGNDVLPLGPLDAIARRLVTALERLGSVRREDHAGEPAHICTTGEPVVRKGKARDIPPHGTITFSAVPIERQAILWGDPVTHISINRGAPHQFLPIVDALSELAPFALLCDHAEEALDPEDFRAREPQPAADVLQLLPLAEDTSSPPLWTSCWQVEGPAYLYEPPFLAPPDRLIVPLGSQLTALDLATGETRWTVSFQGRVMHAVHAAGVIVCAGHHPRCFGLDARTGATLWQLDIPGEAFGRGVALADGSVALELRTSEERGELHVLDPVTGTLKGAAEYEGGPTMSLGAAGDFILVGVGDCVYCHCLANGELCGSFRFPTQTMGSGIMIPGAGPMVAIGPTAVFLNSGGLSRRSLPALDEEEVVLPVPGWGFEGVLVRLAEDILAAGVPVDGEGYKIHVLQGPEIRPLYALPIQAEPSAPVAVTPDTWACLLRPPRQHRDREAEVILVATRTGEVLHREPLGCRGGYPGHVAGGDGWLCATTQGGTYERLVSGIRAYRVSYPASS